MNVKLWTIAPMMIGALAITGCQTTAAFKELPQDKNIRAMPADIDSDGDGVLDDIDECPKTPPNVVVDAKGCPIEIDVGGLEMEFNGFFLLMSSQLPDMYDAEFVKVAENLNDYPKANVFIFGHVATNEIDEAAFGSDSLSRNRALNIKNTLVLQHDIDAEGIRTYDCSNKILIKDTDYINPSFKALNLNGLEAKQRRATLKASSSVKDLSNLKYVGDIENYGKYAKHCELFE